VGPGPHNDERRFIIMKWKLLVAPVLLALGLAGSVALAAPAEAASCTWLDSTYINSGVSEAYGALYRCTDTVNTWYTVSGTLYDTACDNRTAYLDLHAEGQGGTTRSVGGCLASTSYAASWSSPVYGVKLRTRACNSTCSSSASDWLYP
jgi:hypothetical protein